MEPNGFDVHQADEFSPFQEIALDSEDALAILVRGEVQSSINP